MTDLSPIQDVSDTAYWVAHYRAKESARSDALFHDRFAGLLAGDRGWKISDSMARTSQYTEWAVVSRTVIIDRFIEGLLKEGVDAVVNLGAGLDARPYRMRLPASLEWIEVDHPKIIEYKDRLLALEKPACKLSRVAVDLSDASARKAFLDGVTPRSKKVLVLTEGVIPYLSLEQVSALADDLIARPRFCFWITEYFHPKIYPHLKSAIRVRAMKNAPFLFYPEDWYGFFEKRGWIPKETRFSGEIAREFKRMPPMPGWARLVYPLLPKRVKEEALRMSGYVVLKHAGT